ncbi:hypothetical protein DNTS_017740, partial [Danionella cerebrum]
MDLGILQPLLPEAHREKGDIRNLPRSMASNTSENLTFVRPATFFLSGFSNAPQAKYYFVFLSIVYAVTVLGNSFIMCIIYLARRLHTAKYICVFHLALSDLCGSSALIPKVIDSFLFDHQDISYEACLANMFFVLHFMNLQSFTLLALAYDRLVAICFPLHYHAIVTKPAMFLILALMWTFSLIFFSVLVSFVNKISFCRSNVIDTYYCDFAPVFRLACNDNSVHVLLGRLCFGVLICMPPILIFVSYFCISLALLKIAHSLDRIKAIKTCTSHLILVAIFYLPILSNNIAFATTYIHPNARLINNSLTQTIPPMLNPIIYTLKTEEVMQAIKDLFKHSRVYANIEKNNEITSGDMDQERTENRNVSFLSAGLSGIPHTRYYHTFLIVPPLSTGATGTCSALLELGNTSAASASSPVIFIISGFTNMPHAKYYYMFLCFVYVVTVLGNVFIMCVIYLSRRLHTAKYIAVFNLAFSDLCGSSAVIPKLIDMFLFDHQAISYLECLANMFFVFHFMNIQSLTLLALAYDRLVAICYPLKYHAIITKKSMSLILGTMWLFSLVLFAILVGLVNRLVFCGSTVINSYFCDHGPIMSLSCNSNFINYMISVALFGFLICLPVLLITLSYCCIAAALFKIAHGADRLKAMKTCTSHLVLVAIFYLPILSVNVKSISTSIDQNSRIFNNSLTQIIPPMLNPIIYTLKTEEVMQSIKDLYQRRKVNT